MAEDTLDLWERKSFRVVNATQCFKNMNHLLEVHLTKTYPKLFRDMYGDKKKTCMAWGCACGDGWFFLLEHLCGNIQRHIDHRKEMIKKGFKEDTISQVVFLQVKEKFGALRIYYSGGDQYIGNIITYTESLSCWICENCGKFNQEVGRTGKGWIQSLCVECATEYKKQIGCRKELVALWKKIAASRKNPKRAWKGIDEPFTPSDLIPRCDKYKHLITKKSKLIKKKA